MTRARFSSDGARRSVAVVPLLALLLVAVLGSVASAGKQKIAILGLEPAPGARAQIDVADTTVAKELTAALRERPRASIGTYVLAVGSDKELVDEKLMAGCNDEKPSCMAPIGGGIGADVLMYGKIAKTTEKGVEGYNVNLKLIHVGRKQQMASLPNEFLPLSQAKGQDLLTWARRSYKKLTNEESDGQLVIRVSNADRGTVLVDDEPKGNLLSGKSTITLPEGRYRVAVEAEGFRPWSEKEVTIRAGESTTKEVDLAQVESGEEPKPCVDATDPNCVIDRGGTVSQSSSRTWIKVAAVGSLSIAAVTGGLWIYKFGAIRDYRKDLDNMMPALSGTTPLGDAECGSFTPSSGPGDRWQSACDANDSIKILAPVTIAFGVVGLASAIYLVVKSDSTPPERSVTRTGRRPKREFAVTPVVTPDGASATFRLDW